MTPDAMQTLIVQYEELLGPLVQNDSRIEHTFHMLEQTRKFIPHEMDKANRWLGFIQGVLWIVGLRDIDEMRADNRDDDEDVSRVFSTAQSVYNTADIWGG